MDAGGVEEGGVEGWLCAIEQTAAADGEDLAHAVGAVIDAVGIGPGCPNGVSFDDFDNDAVVGDGEEMVAIGFAAEALLPDAPEHPLMTEGGEVGAFFFEVLGFLETTCCITAFGCEHVALYCYSVVACPAPFAAEIEELDVFPLVTETGEGVAHGLVAEVQIDAVAGVVRAGIGEQAEMAGVEVGGLGDGGLGDGGVVEG